MMVTEYTINACYENLANAIVLQACKDYKSVLKARADGKEIPYGLSDLESFFTSDEFELFAGTHIDGEAIMREIERQFTEKRERKKKKE